MPAPACALAPPSSRRARPSRRRPKRCAACGSRGTADTHCVPLSFLQRIFVRGVVQHAFARDHHDVAALYFFVRVTTAATGSRGARVPRRVVLSRRTVRRQARASAPAPAAAAAVTWAALRSAASAMRSKLVETSQGVRGIVSTTIAPLFGVMMPSSCAERQLVKPVLTPASRNPP